MAIYQGDTKISGNAMMVALPMFFATYQPRKLNNPSWLRAEPYSWHSADLYVSAYAHLADNISGVNAQTETIAGTTITFYKLSDEIKVVLPDQQTNLEAIYNATGIGYYFVLDTANRQFKLPRNIYGFTGYRGDVGGYVAPGLPNITGRIYNGTRFLYADKDNFTFTNTGALFAGDKKSGGAGCTQYGNGTGNRSININAALSNSIYGNSTTVQTPATQAYLYFYVGNTVQNETSVDVAEMTEAINDKVDLDLSNLADEGKIRIVNNVAPSDTYETLTVSGGINGEQYTAPADGYFFLTAKPSVADVINMSSGGSSTTVIAGGGGGYNWSCYGSVFIRKGEKLTLWANAGYLGNVKELRFYYAVGSESEHTSQQ